jgi:hypothetical protein
MRRFKPRSQNGIMRRKKVTRLPAGSGEILISACILLWLNCKTGDARPARRLTYSSCQKVSKRPERIR